MLNSFFSTWSSAESAKRIPFGYNLTFNSSYGYLPALKHYEESIRAVHFIGYNKPWTFHRLSNGQVIGRGDFNGAYLKFVQHWWDIYDSIQAQATHTDTMPTAKSSHTFASAVPCAATFGVSYVCSQAIIDLL